MDAVFITITTIVIIWATTIMQIITSVNVTTANLN